MFPRPPSKLEALRLESLLFPPMCQQRAGLPTELPDDAALRAACWQPDDSGGLVCVADPKVAREMADALAEGAQFEPLEVVREAPKAKRVEPRLIVFGGFTRGAAYKLHGKIHSVPCNVYDGTFEDARFWSLSENHRNVQTRGHGSARKAVEVLLASPLLLERVRAEMKRYGTLLRAIAAACMCSTSTVDDVLRDQGKGVSGDRIGTRQAKRSNQEETQSGSGLCQTPVVVSVAVPVEPQNTDPEDAPYTVPRDFGKIATTLAPPATAHAEPDGIDGGLIVEAKDRIADGRAAFDAAIRALRAADEAVRECLKRAGSKLLERITVNAAPVLTQRTVRERRGTGTVEYRVTCSAVAPAVLAAILNRVRPKSLCAGCRGAGCVGCRDLGFVPDDDMLIRDDQQQAFDFPDVWGTEE